LSHIILMLSELKDTYYILVFFLFRKAHFPRHSISTRVQAGRRCRSCLPCY